MLGIVARRDITLDRAHIEPDDLQPASLEPPDDPAGQAALYRVRFEESPKSVQLPPPRAPPCFLLTPNSAALRQHGASAVLAPASSIKTHDPRPCYQTLDSLGSSTPLNWPPRSHAPRRAPDAVSSAQARLLERPHGHHHRDDQRNHDHRGRQQPLTRLHSYPFRAHDTSPSRAYLALFPRCPRAFSNPSPSRHLSFRRESRAPDRQSGTEKWWR